MGAPAEPVGPCSLEPGVNEPADAVVMGDATGGPKGGKAAFPVRQPVTRPAPGSDRLPDTSLVREGA